MPFLDRRAYDAGRPKRDRTGRDRRAYDLSRNRGNNRLLPFVGVDGEGAGGSWIDDAPQSMFDLMADADPWRKWRQHYKLMRIGEEYLKSNAGPLSSLQCLEFVARQPADQLMVGYFFDYDATMILRDIEAKDLREVLNSGFAGYLSWKGYAISYLPKQKLGVGRISQSGYLIKNSMRYIYDVGRFFQCPFTKALKQWLIVDDETLARIQQGKDARGKDRGVENATITDEDVEYNRLECEALAKLMEALREVCADSDCVPRSWTGPGQIASAIMTRHRVLKRKDFDISPAHSAAWNAAYYGGRFEASLFGRYEKTVYEYDIRSAYPYAMQSLPCLEHATIIETSEIENDSVAYIKFSHAKEFDYCAFPIRQKDGALAFPREGMGWYCGREINAARAEGVSVEIAGPIYTARTSCDCTPFAWVREIYDERRRIGTGTKGVALKLGINSIYGKTVQRIGSAPYFNPVWASLITSAVRARLFSIMKGNQNSVIMLATDAIYSTKPLNVDIGDELGQWEEHDYESIFIAKPGIYVAGSSKHKTRGIPLSLFQQEFPKIEKLWIEACIKKTFNKKGFDYPSYQFSFNLFCGARLALQRNYETRGTWSQQRYTLTMDWSNKRETGKLIDYYMMTRPKPGEPDLTSVVFDDVVDREYKTKKLMAEGMPDFFAFDPIINEGE